MFRGQPAAIAGPDTTVAGPRRPALVRSPAPAPPLTPTAPPSLKRGEKEATEPVDHSGCDLFQRISRGVALLLAGDRWRRPGIESGEANAGFAANACSPHFLGCGWASPGRMAAVSGPSLHAQGPRFRPGTSQSQGPLFHRRPSPSRPRMQLAVQLCTDHRAPDSEEGSHRSTLWHAPDVRTSAGQRARPASASTEMAGGRVKNVGAVTRLGAAFRQGGC